MSDVFEIKKEEVTKEEHIEENKKFFRKMIFVEIPITIWLFIGFIKVVNDTPISLMFYVVGFIIFIINMAIGVLIAPKGVKVIGASLGMSGLIYILIVYLAANA